MSLAIDKRYHLAAGAVICAVVTLLTKNLMYGLTAAVLVGAAKEWIYDQGVNLWLSHQGKPPAHDVDFVDFFATAMGGVLMYLAINVYFMVAK